MPKKIKTQLTVGRPKPAVDKSEVAGVDTPKIEELPKKIIGSHMGYMATGGSETAPLAKVPTPQLGRPPKLPPRPRTAPPN